MGPRRPMVRIGRSSLWYHVGRLFQLFALAVTVVAWGSLISCQRAADSPSPADADQPSSTADQGPDIAASIMEWSHIEKFLQTSQPGKIVVVDIWSTSCVPCMRELPHLFELKQKYPDKIAAVSINIDYAGLDDETPDQAREKALEFLRKCAGAEAGIHIVSSTEDTKVYELAEIPSIPAVLVYGPDGKLVKKFGLEGEEFSYEKTITPFVEELLKGSPNQEEPKKER